MDPRRWRRGARRARAADAPGRLRWAGWERVAARVAAAVLGLALLGASLEAADAFKVIVNAQNPIGSMVTGDVSGLFLKKVERWDTGSRVSPVDQPAASACRAAFSLGIHGKDVEAVKKYWRKLVFSGLGEPPQELASEAAVVDFVAHNVGGVGYVCGDVASVERVRVLKVLGGGK